MRILVLSDSHGNLTFARQCLNTWKPDRVIHLGDHYRDALCLQAENPVIPWDVVVGNCDRYSADPFASELLCYPIGGAIFFMTHGHQHGVKSGLSRFLSDARAHSAAIALYGHTHHADCYRESDGMWILNPGTCGGYCATAGIVDLQNGKISACRIISQAETDAHETA